MSNPFKLYSLILAADVVNNGTFVVAYSGSDTSATFDAAGAHQMVEGSNNVFFAPTQFTAAFAGSITITNKTGRTMRAGAAITLQLMQPATNAGNIVPGAAVAALTNSSGGTSGGNTVAAVTDVATAANGIATLAVKLNALLTSLKGAGLIS